MVNSAVLLCTYTNYSKFLVRLPRRCAARLSTKVDLFRSQRPPGSVLRSAGKEGEPKLVSRQKRSEVLVEAYWVKVPHHRLAWVRQNYCCIQLYKSERLLFDRTRRTFDTGLACLFHVLLLKPTVQFLESSTQPVR